MPFVLLGIVGVGATYYLVRRTVSRRAALWSAIILATCTSGRSSPPGHDYAAVRHDDGRGRVFAGLALLPLRQDPEDPDSAVDDLSAALLTQHSPGRSLAQLAAPGVLSGHGAFTSASCCRS